MLVEQDLHGPFNFSKRIQIIQRYKGKAQSEDFSYVGNIITAL